MQAPASIGDGIKAKLPKDLLDAIVPDKVVIIPYIWSSTAEQDLQNRFKIVMSGIQDEVRLLAPEERLSFIVEEMRKRQVPSYFQRHVLSAGTRRHLDEQSRDGKHKISWDHQIETGGDERVYYGTHMKEHKAALNKPLSPDEMLRHWCMLKWLFSSMESKL